MIISHLRKSEMCDLEKLKQSQVIQIFCVLPSLTAMNSHSCINLIHFNIFAKVTIATSAPLYLACSPTITIEGLQESAACASDFESDDNSFAMDSFDSLPGRMVMNLTQSTHAGCESVFSFNVQHCATQSDGHDDLNISLGGYVASKGGSTMAPVIMVSADGMMRPMKVLALEAITGAIGQSSDTMCSENKIYVQLRTTQPLYKTCNPMLTITGLVQSQTADDDSLSVDFWFAPGANTTETTPNGTVHAAWTLQNGQLILPLEGLISNQTNESKLFSATLFEFVFTLRNRLGELVSGEKCDADVSPSKQFTLSIETTAAAGDVTASTCAERTQGVRFGSGSTPCLQSTSAQELTVFSVEHKWFSSLTKRSAADQPLYVAPLAFTTKYIGQDSPVSLLIFSLCLVHSVSLTSSLSSLLCVSLYSLAHSIPFFLFLSLFLSFSLFFPPHSLSFFLFLCHSLPFSVCLSLSLFLYLSHSLSLPLSLSRSLSRSVCCFASSFCVTLSFFLSLSLSLSLSTSLSTALSTSLSALALTLSLLSLSRSLSHFSSHTCSLSHTHTVSCSLTQSYTPTHSLSFASFSLYASVSHSHSYLLSFCPFLSLFPPLSISLSLTFFFSLTNPLFHSIYLSPTHSPFLSHSHTLNHSLSLSSYPLSLFHLYSNLSLSHTLSNYYSLTSPLARTPSHLLAHPISLCHAHTSSSFYLSHSTILFLFLSLSHTNTLILCLSILYSHTFTHSPAPTISLCLTISSLSISPAVSFTHALSLALSRTFLSLFLLLALSLALILNFLVMSYTSFSDSRKLFLSSSTLKEDQLSCLVLLISLSLKFPLTSSLCDFLSLFLGCDALFHSRLNRPLLSTALSISFFFPSLALFLPLSVCLSLSLPLPLPLALSCSLARSLLLSRSLCV